MKELRITLVGDGTFDQALLPIVNWLLNALDVKLPISPHWADWSRLPRPPRSLADRVGAALDLYPCDVLFVHRDAESKDRRSRVGEIERAIRKLPHGRSAPQHVCVVPVRMTEAWLLSDEAAIRRAAGNPNGTVPLGLPPVARWEQLADPKATLHNALRLASELGTRRLARLDVSEKALRIANLATDFSALRVLPAFREFEAETKTTLAALKVL